MPDKNRPDPSPDAPAEGADDVPPPNPGSPGSHDRHHAGHDMDDNK